MIGNVYSIIYEENGGEFVETAPTNATCFVVCRMPVIKKTSWTFDGWVITGLDTNEHRYGLDENVATTTNKDNINTYRIKGDFYFWNLNYTHGATVKFTAQWTKDIYEIHYYTSVQNVTGLANLITPEYYTEYDVADVSVGQNLDSLPLPNNNDTTLSVPNGYKFVGWYFFASQVSNVQLEKIYNNISDNI